MTTLHNQDAAPSPRLFYSTIYDRDRPVIYRSRDGKVKRIRVGERLGPYTLIDPFIRLDRGWGCLITCPCGTERKIYFRNLRNLAQLTPRGCKCQSPWLTNFSRFKSRSSKRGIAVNLNLAQFQLICSLPCVYCAATPSNRYKVRIKDADSFLPYSGIDRIDSSKAYEMGNVLPCCKRCNSAKSTDSIALFIKWINQLGLPIQVDSVLSYGLQLDSELNKIK